MVLLTLLLFGQYARVSGAGHQVKAVMGLPHDLNPHIQQAIPGIADAGEG